MADDGALRGLMQRWDSIEVDKLSALLPAGAQPHESVAPQSTRSGSGSGSAAARERQLREENRALRAETARLSARSGGAGLPQPAGMGTIELVFQALALGVPKEQLEDALTVGTTDGGAATRAALLRLVGQNAKRKTVHSIPPAPIVAAAPVAVEGGEEPQRATKPATVTAHLRHGDAILGDGNAAALDGALRPATSRGLLCSKSTQEMAARGSCGPGVNEARKAIMSRVLMAPLSGDGGAVYAEQWEERWDTFEESRDPEGEALMQNMIQMLDRTGSSDGWSDPDFPADNSSLFKDELSADQMAAIAHGEQTFRKDQDPFLAGVEGIEWKRAAEILDPTDKVVVWSEDIHSDDIQQGRLGNCYYLAALASCAVGEKDVLIRDLIIEEGLDQGVFGVKFYIHGRWVTVPVDDYFPCVPWGDQWKPIFSTPSTGDQQAKGEKEIWPLVFEKAWAKLHGSYEATAGGQTCDALNYLSGGIVRHLHAHEGNEEEWQRLINMQEEHNKHEIHHDREHNPFLSCSVKSAVDSEECKLGGLINGHAYSVLCIVETLDGHRLLNLRNPWGSFEWNGDFSDGSDKWTPELKAEVGADDSEGDDGSFWMCWSDFCKYFDEVGVCDPMFVPKTLLEEGEDFPEKCHTHIKTVGSEWKSGVNAGGRPGFSLATHSESTTFKYNPTFSIKADVDKLILQMYQPDHRGSHDPIPWTDMYLYLVDPSDKVDGDGDADSDGCASKPKRILYLQRRQSFIEIDVEPGKEYHLIASAWGPGVIGRFWISAAGKNLEFNCLESPTPDVAAAQQMLTKSGAAGGPSALCVACGEGPIRGSYFELEEGQCHSECHEAYDLERKKATATKCTFCHERILDSTWSVFQSGDGTKINVHKTCVQGYQESQAPKCEQCSKALVGGYVVLGGKNMHEGCVDAYREAQAPKCPHCGKGVSGSYYPYGPDETISGKDEQVHVECSDAYDAAVQAAKR